MKQIVRPTMYLVGAALLALFAAGIGAVWAFFQLIQEKITSDQILEWAMNRQADFNEYSGWFYKAIGAWYALYNVPATVRSVRRGIRKMNERWEAKVKSLAVVAKQEAPPPADLDQKIITVLTKLAEKGAITLNIPPPEIKKV